RAMRMRVLLRRPPVRRPARVPDAGRATERLLAQQRGQIVELADTAANLDVVVGEGRQPGGVVAPVLELAEPAHENRARVTRPDVADDAAHRLAPFPATRRGRLLL